MAKLLAADAVDFTCRCWEHLLDPKISLKNLIQMAKALYDSFHREGMNSSVVDKRVSLEIRVMKERVTELNGSLRWMSSERQIADGLTKTSARVLLSSHLRHGRLKMTWDPTYQAAKRKTKGQRAAAIAESTPEAYLQQNVHTYEDERLKATEDMPDPFKVHETLDMSPNVNSTQYAFVAQYAKPLEYVLLTSHVASRKNYDFNSRMKYVLLLLALLAPTLASAQDLCKTTCPRRRSSSLDLDPQLLGTAAVCHGRDLSPRPLPWWQKL